jgi:assimilatory nitrate reductase catalytic subunit
LCDGRLEACVFLSPRPDLPSRSWLSGLFSKLKLDPKDRAGLLAGQPARASADAGAIVCSCFSVGSGTIRATVRDLKLTTTAQIGQRLRAGTNCGSCLSELAAILAAEQAERPPVEPKIGDGVTSGRPDPWTTGAAVNT